MRTPALAAGDFSLNAKGESKNMRYKQPNKDNPKEQFAFCSLPDCVFLSPRGTCSKLDVKACMGQSCAFVQTPQEWEKSQQKQRLRLKGLDEQLQKKIARKYYGGSAPWQG